jgi:type VI secretion system secreted protein VgrG
MEALSGGVHRQIGAMDAYTQHRRLLSVETVLGEDHVLVVALRGQDAISSCFSYDLELASTDHSITADKLLGTGATIWLDDGAGLTVPVNGIINRFAALRRTVRGFSLYRVRVVPKLWLLTRTTDCRIFQDKNVFQIVDQVLSDFGVSQKAWKLNGHYRTRDYCVQYRETAFDFISRLMEEEGIFFYFTHDEKNHSLVLTDNNRGLAACRDHVVAGSTAGEMGTVWDWEDTCQFRSSHWTLTDYNFETPSTSLKAEKRTINPVLAKHRFEMFDYPGRYPATGPGETVAKLYIEYEESAYEEAVGDGGCLGFAAGACFKVANAEGEAANVEYVITSVDHAAEDWSMVTQDAKPASYTNRFACGLRKVPYRPARKTHCPRIHGTQTAVVTGPAGEEIYTDKYGRIKVQFFWDRQGKKDENTSCWVRVAQSWAGRTFGTWYLPRIGQEVVVTFEEGDPDRPLVVGSVYNAEQMVPFALPANKTQSGLRTRSSLGGTPANVNEFRFEDKKGSEQVYLHAEKNQDIEVEHDETHWVGHDQTSTIDHDRTEHVKHDETITVDNNRTETVHGNETITIDKNRTETVHQNETVTIDKNRTHTVMQNEVLTVAISRTETVGAAEAITVGASRSVTVGASQTIGVGSDQAISVGGSETVSVDKDRSTSIGQNESLKVGKTIAIEAGDEIVLKTGNATITMKKNGDITIQGKQITIKGSGDVVVKGQKILQN